MPEPCTDRWNSPTPEAAAQKVGPLDPDGSFSPIGLGIGGWSHGLVVTAMRCDDPLPRQGECNKESGIVQLRNPDGEIAASVALWKNRKTQAGGTVPNYLGELDGDTIVAGDADLFRITPAGKVAAKVPRPSNATSCVVADQIYATALSGGIGGKVDLSPAKVKELPPETAKISRWTGSKWKPVAGAQDAKVPAPAQINCGHGRIWAWALNQPAATWAPKSGWEQVDTTGANLVQSSDVSGQPLPSIANDGVAYRIGDGFSVERFDWKAGTTRATGLTLEPASGKTPVSLEVAEQGPNLFACAGRLAVTGTSGSPTTPGTHCGFAPIPS